jgi:hypothetical protein
MTPGLVPNIRQPAPEEDPAISPEDMMIEIIDDREDEVNTDENGNIIEINHPDGSVTISLDGRPLQDIIEDTGKDDDWFRNLVNDIDSMEVSRISSELMRSIGEDIESRKEWIEDRALGIKLLGLKIEIPNIQGAADGAPVDGMSKVRHPLLLEAVLRFQANARSEMLPTDGPVKIRNDGNNVDLQKDQLAMAFERDLNHYLTATATEYYPDTDRMLLMLGFGGTAFKKVYFCPLRNRPISESVDANDLIVNNAATDMLNARRITHRTYMSPSTVKRLQILGIYKNIDLSTPSAPELNAVQREKNSVQGITPELGQPEDRDREIYECYCELNIAGFEHKWKGKETGLEIPYRVTIDVSSKEVLSVVRNYDQDDDQLPTNKQHFVKYTFVPGLGFYDIGLLHILGNTTNAITAAWRELLDAGMYSNFPGFLVADTGARQNTNIFRVPPGGGALVKTGGMPLNQAIMPLPYKEPSGALMTLVDNIAQTGMRIGGTSEQQVGEGKTEMPVGTTLAMLEQAAKVMNAVHKRLHAAQSQEFELIVRTFRENPESFWQRCKKPSLPWDEELFEEALKNCDFVPQADPNTASQAQRLVKISALKQLQQANPNLYDPVAVEIAALQALGWNNPQQFLASPEQRNKPTPEAQYMQSEAQNRAKEADARVMDSQTRAQESMAKIGLDQQKAQMEQQKAQLEEVRKQNDLLHRRSELDHRQKDRESNEKIQLLDFAQDLVKNPEALPVIAPILEPALRTLGIAGLKPPGQGGPNGQ